MEDNRLEMNCELEEMRQQFAIMKERFDRQEIVTDRLLRETQKRRINVFDWLNLYGPMAVFVMSIPLLFLCCQHYGLPIWVAVMTFLMGVLSVILQYCERLKHREAFRFEGDVLQIAGCVRNFRRRSFKMTIVTGLVSVLVLSVGYAAWLPNVQLTDDPFRWILFILLFLGVIAAVVAVEIKSLRILDSIVKDLEQ